MLSLLLELSLFLVDDIGKKLFLESLLCDNEVNDGTLGGHLWRIVWVQHLGLEIELECHGIIHIVTSKSDLITGTLPGDSPLEKGIKSSVDIFFELLEHDYLTQGNTEFELHHPALLI